MAAFLARLNERGDLTVGAPTPPAPGARLIPVVMVAAAIALREARPAFVTVREDVAMAPRAVAPAGMA